MLAVSLAQILYYSIQDRQMSMLPSVLLVKIVKLESERLSFMFQGDEDDESGPSHSTNPGMPFYPRPPMGMPGRGMPPGPPPGRPPGKHHFPLLIHSFFV